MVTAGVAGPTWLAFHSLLNSRHRVTETARNRKPHHADRSRACPLAGWPQPAEAFRHRLSAADDGAYVAGVVGGAPQDRPRVVGGWPGQRPPGGAGERGDAGGRDAVQAASGGDEAGGGADALHGPLVDGGGEAGRPAHLNGELVEFRGHGFLGEQQRFPRKRGDRDAVKIGKWVTSRHQDPERVLAE